MLGPAEDFPPGSVEWAKRISNRLQTGARFISRHSAQHIGATLKQIYDTSPKPWEVWPEDKPFGTPDDYFLAVTGIAWPTLVQTLAEFVPESELNAALARAQSEHRGQGARTDLLGADGTKLAHGTNHAAHLLRRLARDHPDILAAYERGDFPSARAAAKAAGIVKDPAPLKLLQKAWDKASATERATFRQWIMGKLRMIA